MKVFIDGTTGSKWREEVITKLKVSYYNADIDTWDEEELRKKKQEKDKSDLYLYVVTPKMNDFYPIVEVTDDSNKHPSKAIFCFLSADEGQEFTSHQKKSLVAVGKMVAKNGGKWFETLDEVCNYINSLEPL